MLAFPLVHVNASPSAASARIFTDGTYEPCDRGVGVMCGWGAVAASPCRITSAQSRVEHGLGVTNALVEGPAVPRALERAIKARYTSRACCHHSPLVIRPVPDPWACQALHLQRLPRHVARPVHPLDAQVRWTPRTQTAWADQLTGIADRRTMEGSAYA
jgi:ribonuclease HI